MITGTRHLPNAAENECSAVKLELGAVPVGGSQLEPLSSCTKEGGQIRGWRQPSTD